MGTQLQLVTGVVGGGLASTACMWLVGMAVERVRQPSKRPLWVFLTLMAMLAMVVLATGTFYTIYVANTFHGWFEQPVLIFSGNWVGELGGLILAAWAIAFVRGLAPLAPVRRHENLPQTQAFGQTQPADA